MNIQQAAKLMNKSEQFIRIGLQNERLPFGSAVKVAPQRWSYHISEGALKKYLEEGR